MLLPNQLALSTLFLCFSSKTWAIDAPTEWPTDAPTEWPTDAPTEWPTDAPSEWPTDAPTEWPTDAPTEWPTDAPTEWPTDTPTDWPTDSPTEAPTEAPTDAPTAPPTEAPPGTCPDGWINADHLGCFFFDNSKPDRHMNWLEAMDACDNLGGYLAEIKSEEQADFIASIALVEESLTGVDSWWLGLSDMGHEGRWIWGHSITESIFTAWSPGHPNADPHNMDDCVSISFSDHFLWRDVPCYEKTAAAPICQRDLVLDTTTVQPTTTPFPGCPSGWSQHGTSCFKYVSSTAQWSSAQTYCENDGGNLASIHSEEENDFIYSLSSISNDIYIGGTDRDSEGQWKWTDGSAWDYEHWLSDQPDGGRDQNILATDRRERGRWRDLPGNDDHSFVCRMY